MARQSKGCKIPYRESIYDLLGLLYALVWPTPYFSTYPTLLYLHFSTPPCTFLPVLFDLPCAFWPTLYFLTHPALFGLPCPWPTLHFFNYLYLTYPVPYFFTYLHLTYPALFDLPCTWPTLYFLANLHFDLLCAFRPTRPTLYFLTYPALFDLSCAWPTLYFFNYLHLTYPALLLPLGLARPPLCAHAHVRVTSTLRRSPTPLGASRDRSDLPCTLSTPSARLGRQSARRLPPLPVRLA